MQNQQDCLLKAYVILVNDQLNNKFIKYKKQEEKVKIIYATTSFLPSTGGAQTHIFELAKQMRQRHDVEIICHWDNNRTDWLRGVTVKPSENKRYFYERLPVHQINFNAEERNKIAFWAYSYYFLMEKSVDEISEVLFKKIDAVIGDVDIVHVGRIGREFLAWAMFKLARKRKVFVLTPFHHPRWKGFLYRSYVRLYRQADCILTLTNIEKEIIASLGVEQHKIHVLGHAPSGMNSRKSESYFKTSAPVILFLGQKYSYKGIDQIIKAMPIVWAQNPEVKFVFIGPRTGHSRKLFKYIHDPRVIEKERVSNAEKNDALRDCTIFCLPSQQESFGGVFTEAWLYQKPVIGRDIPAVSEIISDSNDGFLVNGSPRLLADKICMLLRNPNIAQSMGKNGYRKVLEKFTWEKIGKHQESIYMGLCRQNL